MRLFKLLKADGIWVTKVETEFCVTFTFYIDPAPHQNETVLAKKFKYSAPILSIQKRGRLGELPAHAEYVIQKARDEAR